MMELISSKDFHSLIWADTANSGQIALLLISICISISIRINYFHSNIHGPTWVASSMVSGSTDDYQPHAVGYYGVLGGILAWGPTIALFSLGWAAKCGQEGTGHGPAQ